MIPKCRVYHNIRSLRHNQSRKRDAVAHTLHFSSSYALIERQTLSDENCGLYRSAPSQHNQTFSAEQTQALNVKLLGVKVLPKSKTAQSRRKSMRVAASGYDAPGDVWV